MIETRSLGILQVRNIPNLISILRVLLVIPVVYLLFVENYFWSLVLFIMAGISDAIDGFLAKKFDWVSPLGEILDPLADKLLMVSCYLSLGWLGQIPIWLVYTVVGRDLVIVIAAIIYHYNFKRIRITPRFISKVNTTVQILLICVVLFSLSVMVIPSSGLYVLFSIVMFTTLVSGIDYVIIWTRLLVRANR